MFEIELGYQFTPEMLLSLNAFSINTRNVLVYGSEGDGDDFSEWYENSTKSGSNGVEVVYSIRKKNWYAHLTYSYSQSIKNNTIATYEVPDERQYVGFPKNKVTINPNFNLTSKLTFNPTFLYASARYAYTTIDVDESGLTSIILS